MASQSKTLATIGLVIATLISLVSIFLVVLSVTVTIQKQGVSSIWEQPDWITISLALVAILSTYGAYRFYRAATAPSPSPEATSPSNANPVN